MNLCKSKVGKKSFFCWIGARFEFGIKKKVSDVLIDLLKKKDPSVSLEVLGKIKSIEARSLVDLLKEEDASVRSVASSLLMDRIKSKKVVYLLIDLLKLRNYFVSDAVYLLNKTGRKFNNVVEPLMIRLLRNDDDQIRLIAIDKLGEIRSKKAIEPLIGLIRKKHEKPWVRTAVIKSLEAIRAKSAVKPLMGLLEYEEDTAVRKAVVTALGSLA